MDKKTKDQRRLEAMQDMQREIEFQLSMFRYDKSVFYIQSCDTKTWFAVEDQDDQSELCHYSQMTVKNFNTFITAGIQLSIKGEVPVSEIIPIMRQSLYVPLTFDVMMSAILSQDNFTEAKWDNIYPGILFLGSKFRVIKVVGWDNKNPSVRRELGQTYYPAMRFREYTKSGKGLWLPEFAHENYCAGNFSTAVSIQTSS